MTRGVTYALASGDRCRVVCGKPPAFGDQSSLRPSAISAEWSAPAFGDQSPAFGDQCRVVCVKQPPLLFGATRRRGMIDEQIRR